MNIGITGVSGFIGREIAKQALGRGWRVTGFSRNPRRTLPFTAEVRRFEVSTPPDFSGLDAVVHLAGESILGIWTDAKKRRIRSSRVLGTMAVAEACRKMSNPPRALVSCSGAAFYGDTGEKICDETSPTGTGFLAEVSREWEAAAMDAQSIQTRVTLVRVGFVLGANGGAMRFIRPLFRAGLGGKIGTGRQWMSLIHIEDVAAMFIAAVENVDWSGPVNAVMPDPVRNVDFTKAVAACARRPAILPAPAFLLRMALGEVSSVALDSMRVVPRRALDLGFEFRYSSMDSAMAASFLDR